MRRSDSSFRALAAPLVGSAALLAGGCSKDATAPNVVITELPREPSVAERQVITSSNAFAFDLLRELRARTTEENVVLSPFSASMALGMAMNGAAGATSDQMRSALRFGALSQEETPPTAGCWICCSGWTRVSRSRSPTRPGRERGRRSCPPSSRSSGNP